MTPPMSQTSPDIAVTIRDLRKTYQALDTTIVAADGITLDLAAGAVTAVTGPSGSGKSTLLHLVGALDSPDSGTITALGQEVTALDRRGLTAYRRSIGIVFQRFNLIGTLNVLDNILIPQIPLGIDDVTRARARDLIAAVGLHGRETSIATRLSGGQQQRVAIARALLHNPRLVLADEPTGNLDSETGHEIVDLLLSLRRDHGTTLVIATHDPALAARCDHIVHLADGRLTDPSPD